VKAVNLPLTSYKPPSANSAKERITAMKVVTPFAADPSKEARVCWENLEKHARLRIQPFLQDLLEAEVTELLGHTKSQRRPQPAGPDGPEVTAAPTVPAGYCNGYGKPRKLATQSGTLVVRRPRVPGVGRTL
jgi:hypothetical protein